MSEFRFKKFNVDDYGCGMKICSDSVLLGAWFLSCYPKSETILDVGTGSGILALMAAQECGTAIITAIDIDSNACNAANNNFANSPWTKRLKVLQYDFSTYSNNDKFDIIISNPPYFTTGALAMEKNRATARHQQGLTYGSLLEKSSQLLKDHGHLGFISPAEFENDIIFKAELCHLKLRRLLRITTSANKTPTRLLWDFAKEDGCTEIHTLNLRDKEGIITSAYAHLVEDYYIKLS